MQKPNPEQRFIYSAYAQSLGATITKPLTAFLTDAPSAALPITGGLIAHEKENVCMKIGSAEILRAGRASASVLGRQSESGGYITVATATIEKLNILDVVTADLVVGKVTSVYPTPSSQPQFFLSGSHFENLKIAGKSYDCHMKREGENGFPATVTKPKAKEEHRPAPKEVEISSPWTSDSEYYSEEEKKTGSIRLEQFGVIHLGEKIIYGDKVILSMFRIELGCPYDGVISGGTGCTNGKNGA